MKPEKGQPVFIDNVDVLLTDRIVHHTHDSADRGAGAAVNAPHRKDSSLRMRKSKWILWAAIGVLIVAAVIACLVFCRNGCCGKRK